MHPALFAGVHLLLGAAFYCNPSPVFFIVLGLIALCLPWKKACIGILLAISTWGYATLAYSKVRLNGPLEGTGRFSIERVQISQSPFQRSYLYTGTLHNFQGLPSISCRIYAPFNQKRLPANQDYLMTGSLIQKGPRSFMLKPQKNRPWQPKPRAFSLAEWRFQTKQSLQRCLNKYYKDARTAGFIHAMISGEMEERELFLEFGRLGLQHILAISGFHFGLLAAFCAFCLQLVFRPKLTAIVSLFILTAYFLWVGTSPSIGRAWIAIVIVLLGKLFHLRCSGLNALGTALIFEIVVYPPVVEHLGFQLSFLCAAAILLLYPLLDQTLQTLLPSRIKSLVLKMDFLNRHGYILSASIRKALALNLSVHLCALPVVLFYFHRFPWLSLAYNLFIPVLAALSLFLFLLSIPLPFLHSFNNALTSSWLYMVSNPPARLDFFLHAPAFPFAALVIWLATIFAGCIYWKRKSSSL